MFKQIQGRQMPVGNQIEEMRIRAASLGGGFIIELIVAGKVETMVFGSQEQMTQTLFTMFNAGAIAAMARGAQPAPQVPNVPQQVTEDALNKIASTAAATVKKKGGRPPLSAEEKAKRAAERKAKKANGADHGEGAEAGAETKAPAEAEIALS